MPIFATPVTVDIELDDKDTRPTVKIPCGKGQTLTMPRFVGSEDIKGRVVVKPRSDTKRFSHSGIRIEFIGQIELYYDKGNHFDFTSLQFDLAPAGSIQGAALELPFEFLNAEKQYESYNGANVRLRYFLRATVARSGLSSSIVKEMDIWVINYHKPPEMNNTIKMEVGVEQCLHIEFEYNKSKYHLRVCCFLCFHCFTHQHRRSPKHKHPQDVVIGKVFFLLVRLRIKYMELSLIKCETSGQRLFQTHTHAHTNF